MVTLNLQGVPLQVQQGDAFKYMKIYTKTGDKGQTSLYGGARCNKDSAQVEAYGTVDELNSALGIVIANLQIANCELKKEKATDILKSVQSDLFSMGALLAGEKRSVKLRTENLELRVKALEQLIDVMAGELPEQRHFILPGGSVPSSHLQLARSICRRAERRVVGLMRMENSSKSKDLQDEGELKLDEVVVTGSVVYLNRLSDFLFTLAKWVNKEQGIEEVEWKS